MKTRESFNTFLICMYFDLEVFIYLTLLERLCETLALTAGFSPDCYGELGTHYS